MEPRHIKTHLRIVFWTIVFYRTATCLVIYVWGRTAWWQGVRTDPWNHYQIGAVLLLAAFMLRKTGYPDWVTILTGVGTGMIIDEISDIVKLFHLYPLPENFRDSAGDAVVIVITYSMYSLICLHGGTLKRLVKQIPSPKPRP